jgi:hypothetical protein
MIRLICSTLLETEKKPKTKMNQPNQVPANGAGTYPTPYEDAKVQKAKMVKKMLYLAYEMGYGEPRTDIEKNLDRKQLCWNHLQAWVKSDKCSVRKTIERMSVDETRSVLTQFEQVYKSFLEAYKRAG